MDPHAEDGPHRGLHDLGVETVGRARRADDVRDAEPVGQPDDRPQIAGVLHVVQHQRQPPFQRLRIQFVTGYFDQRQRVAGGLQQREALHVARGDGLDLRAFENPFQSKQFAHPQVRGAQFADEFLPLGDEELVFGAAAFVGQRADELYFGFGHRSFSML